MLLCVGCQFAHRQLTAPTVSSAVFLSVTDVRTQLYCVSDVSRMCVQHFKCVLMCHAKCFHVFHVSWACVCVCTVCQVCHKCVHMCPADLCSVPNVFHHFILCAQCVSLIFTVCLVCYCVSHRMWCCVAMCSCSVHMCVYITLLTDSSMSASGELTDACYDVICA